MNIKELKKIKNYQPIVLPDGKILKKKSNKTVIDSRKKLTFLNLPKDLTGKTLLDIGCAEGFFLREAVRRGASFVAGVEPRDLCVNINRYVNSLWKLDDKIKVIHGSFLDVEQKYDIVLCLAVLHHYQRDKDGEKFLDTWAMLTEPQYEYIYQNHLKYIQSVADITQELTIYEYPYTYKGYKTKRKDIDFHLLGNRWVKEGLYKRVEFKGLSQKSRFKDRAIYHAYK